MNKISFACDRKNEKDRKVKDYGCESSGLKVSINHYTK